MWVEAESLALAMGWLTLTGLVVTVCIGAVAMGVLPPPSAISWLSSAPSPEVLAEGAEASTGTSIPTLPAGGYMGEGLLPIPEKVVKKILELSFVEMRELMPEMWLQREEEEASGL